MKVLQADDHELFRDGVRYILEGLSDEPLQIVESDDFDGTFEQLRSHQDLDLVLLDLNMPGMLGMVGLRKLVDRFPSVPIVVLSASTQACDIESSLDIGAAGFVPKSSPSDVLLSALRLVLGGGIYAPRTSGRLASGSGVVTPPPKLTRRQLEILSCIAEGMPNKVIASKLFLSESTVKGHVRSLLQALNAGNRVQAINRARETGQLPY